MHGKFEERNHYDTYYFASCVSNILRLPMNYLRNLEAFCGDLQTQYFLKPYMRWSALHAFIAFMVEDIFFEEDIHKNDAKGSNNGFQLEQALRHHGISFKSFSERCVELGISPESDDHHDWYCDLISSEEGERLIEGISRDVFAVLFANRQVLQDLNQLIADHVVDACIDDAKIIPYVNKKGLAKRAAIPQWVSRAVFYRDRGRCAFCQKDLNAQLCIRPQKLQALRSCMSPGIVMECNPSRY